MMLLHISQSKSRGISYLNVRQLCRSRTITQKSVTAWMSTNQHITTNDLVNAFICFIRGAKWTKINHLNGPSPMHDTSTWLSQSIQSIRHVCCRLGMQKNLPWKCFRTAFGHYDFPSSSASRQAWRMRKRYHLLLIHCSSDNVVSVYVWISVLWLFNWKLLSHRQYAVPSSSRSTFYLCHPEQGGSIFLSLWVNSLMWPLNLPFHMVLSRFLFYFFYILNLGSFNMKDNKSNLIFVFRDFSPNL